MKQIAADVYGEHIGGLVCRKTIRAHAEGETKFRYVSLSDGSLLQRLAGVQRYLPQAKPQGGALWLLAAASETPSSFRFGKKGAWGKFPLFERGNFPHY